MPEYPHSVYEKPEEIPFRWIKHVGLGSFGSVDAVEREGKVYARKTFTFPRTPKPRELERIFREIRIAGNILHTHVVRLIETYEHKRSYAIMMDPVAEGNLDTYLLDLDDVPTHEDNGRRMQLSRWFQCLAEAIAYIHDSGVRHRDIKPQNILTLHGNVLLTDFGISEEFQETTISGSTEKSGTKTYRSPEQADGRRSGRREDIFSLGAVFLEMLAVYSGPGKLEELSNIRNGSYSQFVENVDPWIDSRREDASEEADKMPLWYHTMLVTCGLMLEKKRINRPYASDLLALWSCSTIILEYQVSFLPLSFCACIPQTWYSKRSIWESWANVLRHVSNNGEWAPEPQIIAKRTLPEPGLYMGLEDYETSELERVIFGSLLAQTTLIGYEDLCSHFSGALADLTAENMLQRVQRLSELLSWPTATTAAATIDAFIEELYLCIKTNNTEAHLYHQLCAALSGQLANRLHDGAHSETHGNGEKCRCIRNLHDALMRSRQETHGDGEKCRCMHLHDDLMGSAMRS